MIYLCSPYSHPEAYVRQLRYEQACRATAILLSRGLQVFSAIVHNHPLAIARNLPGSWDFWQPWDSWFLSRCDEVYVLMLEGWQSSRGISEELSLFGWPRRPVKWFQFVGDELKEIERG